MVGWWDMPFQGPAAKGPEMPTAPILRDQQPLSAFETVAAKNLFSQDRSNPTAGVAKVQDSLEGRQLLGTMIIGDDQGGHHRGQTPGERQRHVGSRGSLSGRGMEWV